MTGAPELIGVLGPAFFAGAAAIGVTLGIERWGGVVGGFIGTLPSTIVPASIGIALQSASPDDLRAALFATPLGMLVNALFLWLWRAVPPRLPAWGLGRLLPVMTTIALLAWAGGAAAVVWVLEGARDAGMSMVPVGIAAMATGVVIGVAACLVDMPAPVGSRRVGPLVLLARGVMAAVAIGISVWLAHVGGALAAGMAAVFPAIFLTTMVSLWLAQGQAVPAGAVGPMMLGSAAVSVYSMVAAFTLPALGLTAGATVAWIVAVLGATLPAFTWLRRRRLRAAAERAARRP